MWDGLIILFYLVFQIRNSTLTFFLWFDSRQWTFSLKFNFMRFRGSWESICFSQKNWNDWKTAKLSLFENDVCFRDRTLISCKQTITHCEFMSNEAIIKVHDMSCEKGSANEAAYRFDWMTISCFRTSFSKQLVCIHTSRLKNSNRWD